MGRVTASGGAAPGATGSNVGPVSGTLNNGTSNAGLGAAGGILSSLGGLASGVSKGGVSGGIQAAGNAASLYNKATGSGGAFSGLLGQAGQALNIYNGLTSGTPQGVVSGLASGAGLAASSGAAGALGASAATTAALGAAASGIGAVAAIPAVVSGVGNLIFGDLFGMNKGTKTGNEIAMLRTSPATSGIIEKAPSANVAAGGFLAAADNGSGGPRDFYKGHDVSAALSHPDTLQKATDLFKSGNLSAYNQFMQSLISA